MKQRPLLWKRGADTASEDVATPTITTIESQQGDETSSRTKSQSNVSSGDKVSEKNSDEQGKEEKNASKESATISPNTAKAEPAKPAEAPKETGNKPKYTIERTTYTNKKGKTSEMLLVKFDRQLTDEELRAGKELAKEYRGWWDKAKGGFMMRDDEVDSARMLIELISFKRLKIKNI